MAHDVPARSAAERNVRARRSPLTREIVLPVEGYIHSEVTGAVVLLLAAVAAIVWANSPWSATYFELCDIVLTLRIGPFQISEDVVHWINDGLMTLFFFVVALEIKRELVRGELSTPKKAALPVAAALGGMLVPVGIFLAFNWGKEGAHGWGVPMATDIAFALGALALLGKRIPFSLRVFLLAYAIVDDIGSIFVIAIFYSGKISPAPIFAAAAVIVLIIGARKAGIRSVPVYTLLGCILWAAVFKSGIHATIAGVILGGLTPSHAWITTKEYAGLLKARLPVLNEAIRDGDNERAEAMLGEIDELSRHSEAPLERISRIVHPWVNFTVLPLFALANAGVVFTREIASAALVSPVTQGIFVGLIAGKAIGAAGASWLAVKLGIASRPGKGVGWRQIIGVSLLGGIGFTVAIFIAGLAFHEAELVAQAKIGILTASLVAACVGLLFLRFAAPARAEK